MKKSMGPKRKGKLHLKGDAHAGKGGVGKPGGPGGRKRY